MAASIAAMMLLAFVAIVAAQRVVTDKSPVKRVITLLDEMKETLMATAKKEAEMYDKMACWCETNTKEKEKAISDAETTQDSLQADLEAMNMKKGKLATEIEAMKKQIAKDTASLKQATAIREKEKAEFNAEELDSVQIITNLKNAIEILSKHNSLLQLDSPVLASVRAVVQDAALKYDMMMSERPRTSRSAGMKRSSGAALLSLDSQNKGKALLDALDINGAEEALPVEFAERTLARSVAMTQPSALKGAFMQDSEKMPVYKSYAARSSTIFGLLKEMKEEFEATLSSSQKAELQAQADFAALASSKSAEIEAGKAKLDDMETNYAENEKSLSDAREDLEVTSSQRSADVKFLQNVKLECQSIDRDWAARSKGRSAEITAISETIAILTEDDAREALNKVAFLQVSAETAMQMRRVRAVTSLRRATRSPSFAADDLLRGWKARNSAMSLVGPRSQLATLAVSVQLDSFTKVKEMMDKMVADLKQEQADEVAFKDSCNAALNTNEKDTFTAEEEKADLEQKIESLEASIATLKAAIADAESKIAETEVAVKKAGEERKAENEEFQVDVQDQQNIQVILKKALARLEQTYGKKPSLLQRAARAAHEQKPPESFQKYEQSKGASPVMGLISQIIEDSKAAEQEAVAEEAEAQKAYESFLADASDVIASLNAAIKEKSTQKATATSDKETASSELGFTNENLGLLATSKADTHEKCDFTLKNFDIRQKARLDEIEAIQEAKSYLEGALK
mmetsp:Transcript_162001/g.295824  ORF Transcript_162001/g.295824 Transcript_162001/m.295824 type:complete len:746 (-) Transcript_162001:55-2292(-)